MTDTGDEHLYKLAADAQKLDKRPLLDRLREAAKTSHYSLYAEAYCALRSLVAERDLVQIMLDTARKAYRELEPALADALSENDALRAKVLSLEMFWADEGGRDIEALRLKLARAQRGLEDIIYDGKEWICGPEGCFNEEAQEIARTALEESSKP